MSHWAELKVIDGKKIVQRVIVGNNEAEDEGYSLIQKLGGEWIKTSFNARTNGFRKNFAGEGYEYREDLDAFIPFKPFYSWILNEETAQWEAPMPKPEVDGIDFIWVEEELSWVQADRDI